MSMGSGKALRRIAIGKVRSLLRCGFVALRERLRMDGCCGVERETEGGKRQSSLRNVWRCDWR
jgi:hypothetical protein